MPIINVSEEGRAPGMEMSISDCETLSFAVFFGLDLTEEFPVIWLRLRQAINHGAKVIFLGNYTPEISKYFTKTILHAPGQEIAALKQNQSEIAALMKDDKAGAFFVGRQYLNNPNRRAILSELDNLRKSSLNVSLNLMEGKGNSMGARVAGMRPDSGPLGVRVSKPGLNPIQVLEEAANNGWDFLYVAGANPVKKYPSKLWTEARAKLGFLVVQDLFLTETAQQADIVLPTLSFVEKGGSFINIEGRVQKLLPGKEIPQGIHSDGDIFSMLAQKFNASLLVDIIFSEILKQGQIVPVQQSGVRSQEPGARSQESRETNKPVLAATFAPALFDQGVRMKHNSHVIELVKEPHVRINLADGSKLGIKDGDTLILSFNGSTINGKCKFDQGVSEGTVVLPLGFDEIPVHELAANLLNGMVLNVSIGITAGRS